MNKNRFTELFWYGFFGAISTAVNILIFYLLSQKIGIHYIAANAVAWIFSIIFAFATNKIFVFKSKSWKFRVWTKEFFQFALARIATCIFDMGYMFAAISVFGWHKTASKIIANIVVIIANYALSRLWIFKEKSN